MKAFFKLSVINSPAMFLAQALLGNFIIFTTSKSKP